MPKAPDAFRTISEAAKEIGLPAHVLRHWEDTFAAIKPLRRAGGRRYYRQNDLDLLSGVKVLLHEQGFTTKGVSKIFADKGVAYVARLGATARSGGSPATPDEVSTASVTAVVTQLEHALSHIRAIRKQVSSRG